MSHEYYLDHVELYLSHVLTKFLIVGRALCTKNQSHEYYLDCAKITNQSYEFYLECAFFSNQSCVYYLEHLFYSALKSKEVKMCTLLQVQRRHQETQGCGPVPDLPHRLRDLLPDGWDHRPGLQDSQDVRREHHSHGPQPSRLGNSTLQSETAAKVREINLDHGKFRNFVTVLKIALLLIALQGNCIAPDACGISFFINESSIWC